jgi:hypothetical protein
MRFMIPTGNEVKGKHITQVEYKALETNSMIARTNKRKIRAWLVREINIHPTCVKKAMKMLHFDTPERLGVKNYADREAISARNGGQH